MVYPVKTCVKCGEEFELRPNKPGFANQCPDCSDSEAGATNAKSSKDADERRVDREANEERKRAMRDLLYRKDS
jgi:hypothetical protein